MRSTGLVRSLTGTDPVRACHRADRIGGLIAAVHDYGTGTKGVLRISSEKRTLVTTAVEQELVVSNKTVGKHKWTRFGPERLEERPRGRFDAVQREEQPFWLFAAKE